MTLLLLVPAGRSESVSVIWAAPTPTDHTEFTVKARARVSFALTASASIPDAAVYVKGIGLPTGADFSASGGSVARATFAWTPERAGVYKVQFAATTAGASAPTLSYRITVKPNYPFTQRVSTALAAQWTVVARPTVARAQPKSSSRVVSTLDPMTSDETQNVVLVLDRTDTSATETWYRVRLPILPNNSTGWVSSKSLGKLYTVETHLYVDRAKLTATLTRNGVTVFTARVGVGKSYWPTPRGEFYIRSKLAGFGDPFYGPIAFGTSARSAVLTDWPGGGFVGVHGTSLPQLLPGRVSHGCIRMRNQDILKLAQLMPVGTPLTIR